MSRGTIEIRREDEAEDAIREGVGKMMGNKSEQTYGKMQQAKRKTR